MRLHHIRASDPARFVGAVASTNAARDSLRCPIVFLPARVSASSLIRTHLDDTDKRTPTLLVGDSGPRAGRRLRGMLQ
jgi:hypothetical protein